MHHSASSGRLQQHLVMRQLLTALGTLVALWLLMPNLCNGELVLGQARVRANGML